MILEIYSAWWSKIIFVFDLEKVFLRLSGLSEFNKTFFTFVELMKMHL